LLAKKINFLGINDHPRALFYLFFAELWERFSFYGMRALLVLYMTIKLGFSDHLSYGIYAAYGSLVYFTPLIGGFIADHFLGNKKSILAGGMFIAIGHLVLTIPSLWGFYFGLAFVIVGTGLFKANISSFLGQFYKKNDPRRDSGFTIFYMGINLGSFIASLVCGYLGQTYGWHYGFGLASIGMIVGLFTFVRGYDSFAGLGNPPNGALSTKVAGLINKEFLIYALCLIAVPCVAFVLMNSQNLNKVFPYIISIIICATLFLVIKSPAHERNNILVIIALSFFNVIFWALFEQAGSSLTLFADRFVSNDFFGLFNITSSQWQALNPLFIILLTPIFAKLWLSLGKIKKDPYPPFKFLLGIVQVSLGFGALVIAISVMKNHNISSLWLILTYFIHTTGELCISPVGLAMVTKLSPARHTSTLMGYWFLSFSFAHYLGGFFAKMASANDPSVEMSRQESLIQFSSAFYTVTIFSIISAAILVLCLPLLSKVFKNNKASSL
jgi:proton-dependent oligopeptide transporter, POT family